MGRVKAEPYTQVRLQGSNLVLGVSSGILPPPPALPDLVRLNKLKIKRIL